MKELNGTFYSGKTSEELVILLEQIRRDKIRVRFHWGDITTGRDWGDDCGVYGTIGRSMGPIKIPILLHNRRSTGGGAILDDCIVKIAEARGKRLLYQHPKYFV